ncbi:sensor histidine kinase [Streptomyces graminilatus]|uniref:sensor histidine kinase n=1 Tax=Streptomyces graminilatus TaxID=1464070 RepID=UPI0006E39576|nr:histidine kinase [Streptomyces graminilatus]
MTSRLLLRLRAAVPPLTALLLLGLGLLDLRYGMLEPAPHGVFKLKLVSVLLAGAMLVAGNRLGPRGLPAAACAAVTMSLGTTAAIHHLRPPDGSDVADGFTEPATLLALLVLVAWRAAPVWTTVTAPALVAAVVLRPLSDGTREGNIIQAFFWTLAAIAALAAGLAARLVALDRKRRESTIRLEQRAEFARDLHDFVAHHVTGIVVQAQGAHMIAAKRPELVLPALERIERSGAEALTSMRAMVGMLRAAGPDGNSPVLAPLAGMDEIQTLVEEFATVGGSRPRLLMEGSFDGLPVEVVTTLHRVVMEALTNVRKHAREAAEVEVRLVRSADRITVTISDDGRARPGLGLGNARGGGFGLTGLAERVGMIGGTLRAGPGEARGWSVEATLRTGAGA